ncbi:hypothetical protein EV424DRAFT_1351209 [Suillus variegatus]|nr:hypothetical protein EV424DRAFT_1351209 [Suillus variegatus]
MYQPQPETRDCWVSGIGCPELGTWDNLGRSIQFDSQSNIPSSEFWTPDTRDPAVSDFGYRVSGTRNSKIGFVAHQGSGVGFFHFSPGLLVNATHGRFMFLCLGV